MSLVPIMIIPLVRCIPSSNPVEILYKERIPSTADDKLIHL